MILLPFLLCSREGGEGEGKEGEGKEGGGGGGWGVGRRLYVHLQ
jgi:hypothetical protein